MRVLHRIKDPVRGTAQVVSSTMPAANSTWCTVRLQLVVQADGVPPFSLEHKCSARTDRWPHAGTTLPVVFDREHPDRLDIQWDDVPKARDQARAQAEAMAEQLRSGAQGGVSVAGGGVQVIDARDNPELRSQIVGSLQAAGISVPAAQGAGGEDSLDDRLAKLAELHESGALSDEEFRAAKAKLLGTS